jgi:hypothetical protein
VYKLWNYSKCSLFHPLTTFTSLGPNILLSTLFSNTFNLCSFLSMRDKVSHLNKTPDKIMVLYILIFKSSDRKQEERRYLTKWQQAFPEYKLLLTSWKHFWFVTVIHKYWRFATVSNYVLATIKLWLCSTFWCREICLVFSAFISGRTSSLTSSRSNESFSLSNNDEQVKQSTDY